MIFSSKFTHTARRLSTDRYVTIWIPYFQFLWSFSSQKSEWTHSFPPPHGWRIFLLITESSRTRKSGTDRERRSCANGMMGAPCWKLVGLFHKKTICLPPPITLLSRGACELEFTSDFFLFFFAHLPWRPSWPRGNHCGPDGSPSPVINYFNC